LKRRLPIPDGGFPVEPLSCEVPSIEALYVLEFGDAALGGQQIN
jgi:hypothetical protein